MTMVHVQLRPTEFGTCGPQKSRMAVFRINVTLLQGFAFSLGNIADCKEVQSVQNFGELQRSISGLTHCDPSAIGRARVSTLAQKNGRSNLSIVPDRNELQSSWSFLGSLRG